MNINKILNNIRKRAGKIECPKYLTDKIMKDIDNGYKDYKTGGKMKDSCGEEGK